jgi:hypothetical protein
VHNQDEPRKKNKKTRRPAFTGKDKENEDPTHQDEEDANRQPTEEQEDNKKPTTKLAHIPSPLQQASTGGGRGWFRNKAVQQDDQRTRPARKDETRRKKTPTRR